MQKRVAFQLHPISSNAFNELAGHTRGIGVRVKERGAFVILRILQVLETGEDMKYF